MKYLVLIILGLTSCADNDFSIFTITNPKNDNQWARHLGLPEFNVAIHSDGCSGGMSAIYQQLTALHENHGKTLKWRQCCEIHDKAYYYGGTKLEKKQADVELNNCVTQVLGDKFLGQAMQMAVEMGGGPSLPTPYRWGYGEDFR